MFLLFEDWKLEELLDRPDLGIASLMGVLKANDYTVHLMLGQTRYLQIMLNSFDEICTLFSLVKSKGIEEKFINYFSDFFSDNSRPNALLEFVEEYYNRRIQAYFQVEKIMDLEIFFKNVVALYKYFIENEGYDNFAFLNSYKKEIKELMPVAVGFSVHSFDDFTRNLRKYIKDFLKIPVIIGGPITHYINNPDIARDILENEHCDYILIGPGEENLIELLECLENNKSLDTIGNLIYLNAKGEICFNKEKPVFNLNKLPFPDYSKYQLDKFFSPFRVLPIQTSRGCSWRQCTFCSHHKSYQKYQTFDINNIVNLVKYLKNKYDCNYFTIHDEEISPVRLEKLSLSLITSDIKAYFYGYARFSKHFTKEIFDIAYHAGFRTISWGLESGSQRVLDLMNKGISVDIAAEKLKLCKDSGISNICWVMFGFPGETDEDRQKTIDFLERNREYINLVKISYFKLSKESPIAKEPQMWDIIPKENNDYYRFVIDTAQDNVNITYVEELLNKLALGVFDFTTYYKYLPENNLARMFIFFLACHRVKSDFLSKTEKKFPILIGDLKNKTIQDYSLSYTLNSMFTKIIDEKIPYELFLSLNDDCSLKEILKKPKGIDFISYLLENNSMILLNKKF
ncbi:MAG: B12-binding domain-containing radical SAM protein [Halanaerobiales bacterium]|nr:B12-binding domain-containing radical SAM protein [Halanaerobiales bacterium]